MRAPGLRWLLVVLVPVVAVAWSACGGGTSASGSLDPTGGSVCLADRSVCLEVPAGALADYETFKISPAPDSQVPAGALSPGYIIEPTSNTRVTFLKPARVIYSLELVNVNAAPNENLLRIYSWEEANGGDGWQPLAHSFVDRVKFEISGEIDHLVPGPFVVLRADLLPDGGPVVEGDAGMKPDSGVVVVPPRPDGGEPDAGEPDAGEPDAGPPDAGPPDAGPPDAGPPDAGPPDAGPPDAGPPDAGPPDAGPPDAGPPDAGPPDAGPPDAGPPDAGPPDAGPPDAGPPDAGPPDAGDPDAGVDGG